MASAAAGETVAYGETAAGETAAGETAAPGLMVAVGETAAWVAAWLWEAWEGTAIKGKNNMYTHWTIMSTNIICHPLSIVSV